MRWLGRLAAGRVRLGRVHIACGEALVLEPETDVPALANAVVAEQQRVMAVSRFHLRAFAAEAGVDAEWLAHAITKRGGRVLDSDLPAPERLSPELGRSLRNQWIHWFYGDALALFPDNDTVASHVAQNAWAQLPKPSDLDDPSLKAVVTALMETDAS